MLSGSASGQWHGVRGSRAKGLSWGLIHGMNDATRAAFDLVAIDCQLCCLGMLNTHTTVRLSVT